MVGGGKQHGREAGTVTTTCHHCPDQKVVLASSERLILRRALLHKGNQILVLYETGDVRPTTMATSKIGDLVVLWERGILGMGIHLCAAQRQYHLFWQVLTTNNVAVGFVAKPAGWETAFQPVYIHIGDGQSALTTDQNHAVDEALSSGALVELHQGCPKPLQISETTTQHPKRGSLPSGGSLKHSVHKKRMLRMRLAIHPALGRGRARVLLITHFPLLRVPTGCQACNRLRGTNQVDDHQEMDTDRSHLVGR
mmetsp:Transcript_4215/g.12875  ORF Transcript_4215/g.12875 Transcript_4215/m.12875 type:complete len:253 (-) Transcript_4215:624-1382(-)